MCFMFSTSNVQTPRQASTPNRFYTDPLPWLIVLAVAHVVTRMAISHALMWDEAEQVLWTQHLRWGYGAQPPLYTWLQWLVFHMLGPTILALSLLKHALIVLACILMWLAGRQLLGPRSAWWAAASLLLLPVFGWNTLTDLTHTVLVTAMTCGVWWLVLRIMRREGRGCQREFVALGLVCGCGLLAKYNFVPMLAALVVALVSVRATRRALFGRGWWWAVLIAALMAVPHGVWVLSHWHLATAVTFGKMDIAQHGWWEGLSNLVGALLALLGLWVIVALATFRSSWWRQQPGTASDARPAPAAPDWLRPVFVRYLGVIGLMLLVMVFGVDITVFKDRWLLPMFVPVPLMAFALRPELETDARGRWFTGVTLVIIALLLIAEGVQPWFSTIAKKSPNLFNQPAQQLAMALKSTGYDGQGRIIAADSVLAGTLRMRFPDAPAQTCMPELTDDVPGCVARGVQAAEHEGRGWLIISRADHLKTDWWEQALSRIPGSEILPRGNLEIPYRMVRRGQPMAHYDFVWHPAQPSP